MLTITLLGTAATMPLPDRALRTAFATCCGHGLPFCFGEGTQAGPRRAGGQPCRAGADFLAPDVAAHIIRLPGLLPTQRTQGRPRPPQRPQSAP